MGRSETERAKEPRVKEGEMDVKVVEVGRRKRRRDDSDSIWFGVLLIFAGVAFLLHHMGVLPWTMISTWWPMIVIAMGAASVVSARSPRKLGSAVTFMLMGVYFLLADGRMYGLNWGNSWPLALVAVGTGMVVRSIAAALWRHDDEEDVHVS